MRALFFPYLFALYLALGPIYWLPVVGATPVSLFKSLIFAAIASWAVFVAAIHRDIRLPGGYGLFAILLFILVWTCLSIFYGDLGETIYRAQNIIVIFAFLLAFGHLERTGKIFLVARAAVLMFMAIVFAWAVLAVVAPTTSSPINNRLSLYRVGFGGTWVDWSPSLALYLPWLYATALFPLLFARFGTSVALFGQVAAASRAGFLATAASFLFYALQRMNVKKFLLVALIVVVGLYFVLNNLDKLRLAHGSLTTLQGLNELSTNRIGGYAAAIASVWEDPLFGQGVGRIEYEGGYYNPHNLFLRAFGQGGLPYGAAFILLYVFILLKALMARRVAGNDWTLRTAGLLTVLAGMTSAMFAPGYTIGSFNSVAFWWFCVCVCIRSGLDSEQLPLTARQPLSATAGAVSR